MLPLVSILIPAYNAEEWIAGTLKSTLEQTWPHKEIIVVDDGSKDKTLAVAQSYADQGVKVISQTNSGASAARNRAIAAARGEFFQFLDADDLLAPDKIERQMALVDKIGNQYLISGEWARFYRDIEEAQFVGDKLWSDLSPRDWLIYCWENNSMMHPGAWLVPRANAERAGKWDERLSLNDDGEYFCRVILTSPIIKFCAGAKSYYRSGLAGSLSQTTSEKGWRSLYLAVCLSIDHLLAIERSSATERAAAALLQMFIYTAYPAVPDLIKSAEERVKHLGGSNIIFPAGPKMNILVKLLGWKFAKKIKEKSATIKF